VAERLALVVVALGVIAVAGMLARVSTTDGRVTLATCSGFGSYYARGSGC
jgi:hypothetical protein